MIRFLSGRRPRLPEQDHIELPNQSLHYRIRESARRRTLALELRADGTLTVATPAGLSQDFIRRFVASRVHWIDSKRGLLAQDRAALPVPAHGARLPYLGGELTVHHDRTDGTRSLCRRDGDRLLVRASDAALRPAVERWYRAAAADHFATRIAHFSPQVGRHPIRLTVRAPRTRWGSCTGRGTISLNWRLMQLPPEILDYVVVHELCHLLVPNHSPRFWSEVARILPDWQTRRARLRTLGRRLPV